MTNLFSEDALSLVRALIGCTPKSNDHYVCVTQEELALLEEHITRIEDELVQLKEDHADLLNELGHLAAVVE